MGSCKTNYRTTPPPQVCAPQLSPTQKSKEMENINNTSRISVSRYVSYAAQIKNQRSIGQYHQNKRKQNLDTYFAQTCVILRRYLFDILILSGRLLARPRQQEGLNNSDRA